MPRPRVNERTRVTVVNEFPHTDPRWSETPLKGAPGVYAAQCVLAIPGHSVFRRSVDVAELLTSGDSLLSVGRNVKSARFNIQEIGGTAAIELTAWPNSSWRLGRITLRFRAESFDDARAQAHNQVNTLLSWLAFRHNVALDVTAWQIKEEATQSTEWQVGFLGQDRPLALREGISKVPYRAPLAAYREGLNATNPFYSALCFFKVVTYTTGLRRQRRRNSPLPIADPSDERFPADLADPLYVSDPAGVLGQYAGATFGKIRDSLRETVRNALAHLDAEREDTILADRYADVEKCERAVPVLRHMARVTLKNELLADPNVTSVDDLKDVMD